MLNRLTWSLFWLAPIAAIATLLQRAACFPLDWGVTSGVLQGGFIAVYLVGHLGTCWI